MPKTGKRNNGINKATLAGKMETQLGNGGRANKPASERNYMKTRAALQNLHASSLPHPQQSPPWHCSRFWLGWEIDGEARRCYENMLPCVWCKESWNIVYLSKSSQSASKAGPIAWPFTPSWKQTVAYGKIWPVFERKMGSGHSSFSEAGQAVRPNLHSWSESGHVENTHWVLKSTVHKYIVK